MGHSFIYQLKCFLRDKAMIFWTLMFPIVLATLFHFAFSNLASIDSFEPMNIGIVANDAYYEKKEFAQMITELSKEHSGQLFKATYYQTKDTASDALQKSAIEGFYLVTDKIEIVVSASGTNQTIMKNVVDQYYQTMSIAGHIGDFQPQLLQQGILQELNKTPSYFHNVTNENTDASVIYFYTLLAMTCMYSAMFGLQTTTNIEANLSQKGARVSIAPTNKKKVLLSGLGAGCLLQYIFLLILLFYMTTILKIDFGSQIAPLLLLIGVGTLTGSALGVMVGVLSKKNETLKIGILISTIMLGCFLSGMMLIDMKYLIQEHAPFLAIINPLNVITDALYSLYYYTNFDRYFMNIGILLLLSLVMFFVSYLYLRRKRYDSI